MKVTGGQITLGYISATDSRFRVIHVQGDAEFTGGTFNTKVNGTNADRDLWKATGTFKVTDGAKVEITVKDPPVGGVGNRIWEVIQADGLFTNNSVLPGVTNGWEEAFNSAKTRLRVNKS